MNTLINLIVAIAIVAGAIIWQNQLRKAEWSRKNEQEQDSSKKNAPV